MSRVTSNLPEIRRSLFELGQILNFRRRPSGGGPRVGEEILAMIATVIEERTIRRQQDPLGRPLAPLRPSTLTRKRRLGYPSTIGVEEHKMLAFNEIRGDQMVTDKVAAMTYGQGSDQRAKAEWFQDPSNPNQAAREFYDIGKDGEKLVDRYIADEVIERRIKELGGV